MPRHRQLAAPPFKLQVDGVPPWINFDQVEDLLRQPLTVNRRGADAPMHTPSLDSFQGGFVQRLQSDAELRSKQPNGYLAEFHPLQMFLRFGSRSGGGSFDLSVGLLLESSDQLDAFVGMLAQSNWIAVLLS